MTIEPSLIVWTVLCFLALVLILKKLLFQPMLTFMDARNAKIEAARKAKEQAHAEYEAKMRSLAEERAAQAAQLRQSDTAALESAREVLLHRAAEQHWQNDRHSAVDAETVAAPYADMEHLTAGDPAKAATNRTK